MPLRPCLSCGGLQRDGARHRGCARPIERAVTQRKRERRPYTNSELVRRAEVVAQWRATVGDWCPGWQRAAHPSSDLTADHPVDVVLSHDESQPLTVLCRPCNGAKGVEAGGRSGTQRSATA